MKTILAILLVAVTPATNPNVTQLPGLNITGNPTTQGAGAGSLTFHGNCTVTDDAGALWSNCPGLTTSEVDGGAAQCLQLADGGEWCGASGIIYSTTAVQIGSSSSDSPFATDTTVVAAAITPSVAFGANASTALGLLTGSTAACGTSGTCTAPCLCIGTSACTPCAALGDLAKLPSSVSQALGFFAGAPGLDSLTCVATASVYGPTPTNYPSKGIIIAGAPPAADEFEFYALNLTNAAVTVETEQVFAAECHKH